MSPKNASDITAGELVEWIQQEKIRAGERELKGGDVITKSALQAYRENLDFLQQDILRLSIGITKEPSMNLVTQQTKALDKLYIYKNECFDVGDGGADVVVYRTLEDAIAAHPAPKNGQWASYPSPDKVSGSWRVQVQVDGDRLWQENVNLSGIQSITEAEFGELV